MVDIVGIVEDKVSYGFKALSFASRNRHTVQPQRRLLHVKLIVEALGA